MGDLPGKPTLSWLGKFRVAIRGIYFGSVGQASFAVHLAAMLAVIVLAVVLRVDLVSWALLAFSIGIVITTELINSAVESLFHGLPDEVKERSWPALDIAAGAVLAASVTAGCIGGIVFVPRLLSLF